MEASFVSARSQSSFNLSNQDVREGARRCGGDPVSSSMCHHSSQQSRTRGSAEVWAPKHILIGYVVVQSEHETVCGGDASSSSSRRRSIDNITTQK
jgi:hypothetical protein